VIQGISIGARCLVAAGSVVIRDVPDDAEVMGVPAAERRR
jgi:acetyltransferase-like isoleucine patch superfamily enzyme